MKTIRYAFWAIVALCLILIGLANRDPVTVRAMPVWLSDLLGLSPDVTLPLFVVIFIGVGAGLAIGFLWEWVREYRIRADARAKSREVEALRSELQQMRTASVGAKSEDDVLVLLENTR
ncbi:lipopolysaccharide assembly protein LapA domain-containing protein [Yoonia vestfoldensis]|uniref:lipopolysaccharide assembly protein LapA domain-containing protein n=1 Tax=Yoonia vestfoldensis TaxID=245188 RepID=UPI00036731C8|nr:LapA family protein [Yoonia vestfoldensis]